MGAKSSKDAVTAESKQVGLKEGESCSKISTEGPSAPGKVVIGKPMALTNQFRSHESPSHGGLDVKSRSDKTRSSAACYKPNVSDGKQRYFTGEIIRLSPETQTPVCQSAHASHQAIEPTIEASQAFLKRFAAVKAVNGWASAATGSEPVVALVRYESFARLSHPFLGKDKYKYPFCSFCCFVPNSAQMTTRGGFYAQHDGAITRCVRDPNFSWFHALAEAGSATLLQYSPALTGDICLRTLDGRGRSILSCALSFGHDAFADQVMEMHWCALSPWAIWSLWQPDKLGNSPMTYAIERGCQQIVKSLINTCVPFKQMLSIDANGNPRAIWCFNNLSRVWMTHKSMMLLVPHPYLGVCELFRVLQRACARRRSFRKRACALIDLYVLPVLVSIIDVYAHVWELEK